MEEKLSLNTYSNSKKKRLHSIHGQAGIYFSFVNLISTSSHFTTKICKRTISTSSQDEPEPVLIYTSPDEHKGLIIKQNKGKSGVYR